VQALVWIVRFLIVVVLVWFAVKNAQMVTLHGLPDQQLQAPLVFVLLVVFVAGVVIGLLAWIPTVVRQRRELGRLRRAAEKQEALAAMAASAEPATPPQALPASPEAPPSLPGSHGV
jgi:uncharacterized integral membrane protein